jgi:hypothetical protein
VRERFPALDVVQLSGGVQRYMEAAEIALNAALHAGEKPETTKGSFTLGGGKAGENIGKQLIRIG